MGIFYELKNSNVWSESYNLPLVPMHANPSIYTAYTTRILESLDVDGSIEVRVSYLKFLRACESEPGLITTFPGTYSPEGMASHDDVMGAAFMSVSFATRVCNLLAMNDGIYGRKGELEDRNNFYRFLFVRTFLRAMGGFHVGLVSQIQYVASLLFHLVFTEEGDTSGHLLMWLTFPVMRQFPLCAGVIAFWSDRWTKRGYTPKKIFTKFYLNECPWFAAWARDDWK